MRNRYQLMNRSLNDAEAIATRARVARRGGVRLTDPTLDDQWARLYVDSEAPNPYFDYYFSAQDIRVYVAELGDDIDFGHLPIHDLGFRVEQEKAPIYGYGSYTYDAVMRGTRLISGQFTLITKHPNYMKNMLTKAAVKRAENHANPSDDYPAPGAWREDDENIDRYWGKHLDASALAQGQTEWSIHPPFSFVIVYGVQDTSLEVDDLTDVYNNYERDNALMFDRNQRLVEGFNPNDPSRIILDGCELMAVQRVYSSAPGQQIVAETYEFFARDVFVPEPEHKTNINQLVHGGRGIRVE